MNSIHNLPFLILILISVSCSRPLTVGQGRVEDESRPDDFNVEYYWSNGSLPPPYHYEYHINIKPSGETEVFVSPDYPAAAVLKLTEKFTMEAKKIDALYHLMVEKGIFKGNWRHVNEAITGGSTEGMTITARTQRIAMEDYPLSEETVSAKELYSAVRALVPKEIENRLTALREEYERKHRH